MARPNDTHRHYLRTVAASALAVLGVVMAVNAGMDPLWCLGAEHGLNTRKLGFDERQQKTNVLAFRSTDYDAVLLGSSRAAFLHARDFTDRRLFNYGADDMSPAEAALYLTYTTHRLGPRLKAAYLAVDFESTKRTSTTSYPAVAPGGPLRAVSDPLYRFKLLLSGDAFGKSLEGLTMNLSQATHKDFYDPTWQKTPRRTDDAVMMRRTTRYMNAYRRRFRYAYQYDPQYPQTLQAVQAAAAGRPVVVFSPPTSAMFLAVLQQEHRMEDYKRWVRETAATTGGFYLFNYPNSVTRDLRNFLDGQHLRPEIGRWMVAKVLGHAPPEAPADFGVYLTPDNVEAFLTDLRF